MFSPWSFRIASLSKIFPTLMLYRLWEDGKIGSLDDPLEKYVENFTIKNPLGKTRDSELKYVTDGLIFLDSGEVPIRSSSVTLRRMASQLSGTEKQQRKRPSKSSELLFTALLKGEVLTWNPNPSKTALYSISPSSARQLCDLCTKKEKIQ